MTPSSLPSTSMPRLDSPLATSGSHLNHTSHKIAQAYETAVKLGAPPILPLPATPVRRGISEFYKKRPLKLGTNSRVRSGSSGPQPPPPYPPSEPITGQQGSKSNAEESGSESQSTEIDELGIPPGLSHHFLISPKSVDKFRTPSAAIPFAGWDDFHQKNETSRYPLFRIALCGDQGLVKHFHHLLTFSRQHPVEKVAGWFGDVIGIRIPTVRGQHRNCLVELIDIHCPTDIARFEIQREIDGYIIIINPHNETSFLIATEYHRWYYQRLRNNTNGGIKEPHPRGFLVAARKSCRRNYGLVDSPAASNFSELFRLRYYEYNVNSRTGPKSIVKALLQCIDRNQLLRQLEIKRARRFGMDLSDPSIKAQLPKLPPMTRFKHWFKQVEVPVPKVTARVSVKVSIRLQRKKLLRRRV